MKIPLALIIDIVVPIALIVGLLIISLKWLTDCFSSKSEVYMMEGVTFGTMAFCAFIVSVMI